MLRTTLKKPTKAPPKKPDPRLQEAQALVLSVALNGVLAKLAVCDGPVTDAERQLLYRLFVQGGWLKAQHLQFFVEAQADTVPLPQQLARIKKAFGKDVVRIETLFDKCLKLAAVDGLPNLTELSLLSEMGLLLGLNERHMRAKMGRCLMAHPGFPKTQKALRIQFHPDKAARGHALVQALYHDLFVESNSDTKPLAQSR